MIRKQRRAPSWLQVSEGADGDRQMAMGSIYALAWFGFALAVPIGAGVWNLFNPVAHSLAVERERPDRRPFRDSAGAKR